MNTDFSAWDRATLEQFARDVYSELLVLQADQRVLLDSIRLLIKDSDKIPSPASVPPAIPL